MNRKLKSVFAVFTALVMVLSFAACGKTDKTAANADEAKKVADEFLNDISKLKFKDASEIMDDAKVFEDYKDINGTDDLVKLILKDVDMDGLEQVGVDAGYVEEQTKKQLELLSIEYEITDSEAKDDKTVEVKFKMTCTGPKDDAFDAVGTKYSKEAEEYIEEHRNELSANPTEEEVKALNAKALEYINDLAMEDAKENPETTNADGKLVLKNEDGKWIICADDSDLDDMAEIVIG